MHVTVSKQPGAVKPAALHHSPAVGHSCLCPLEIITVSVCSLEFLFYFLFSL